MKILKGLLLVIAVFFAFATFAQNPSEGYVLYDSEGMPRQVMNLEVKKYAGTDNEIANQFLNANKLWISGGENGNYEFTSVIENPSGKHFTYIQKISGIPVLGSGLVISVNNNHYISHVYNGYRKNLNPSTVPVITAQQAIELAINTFNPGLQLLLTPSSELYIYEDESHIAYLIYNVVICSYDTGTYQILVDANNSAIISKTSMEFAYETGTGRVWDPNPEALGIPHIDPDHDVDDPSYTPAYVTRTLQGLNSPVSSLYYLKGEFASSFDLSAPAGLIPGQSTSDFLFNRNQIGFEETNCYYHTDKILRYINSLGFNPTWNNQTTATNKDIVFDARAGYQGDKPFYMGLGLVRFPYPSGAAPGADAGEDESIIVHETGHAVHDALLPFGISGGGHPDLYGISEGIANYFGIGYRRQTSLVKSTWATTWYRPGDLINNSSNFTSNWPTEDPRTCSSVWAGALFDLEYISATDPTQGYRLGREVVSINQLSSLSYLTNNSSRVDNVLAMYQADLDTYEGLHLREYIDVYYNRQLFTDQNVYGNLTGTVPTWNGYKKINGTIHALSGSTINIASNCIIVMNGELTIDAGATINIGTNVTFIGYQSDHRVIVYGNLSTEGSPVINNLKFRFVGAPGSTGWFGGLSLLNLNQAVTLTNSTFTKARLIHNGGGLTVTNSTFTDCNNIMSYTGNITMSACSFTKTGLNLNNIPANPNVMATINTNCVFDGQLLSYGIYLQGYKKYLIENNSISNYLIGIKLTNSGSGILDFQTIKNNTITSCSQLGIYNYYSKSDIQKNHIYNCGIGLGLYNTSNVSITGVQDPPNAMATQMINDNSSYEVLTSYASFPSPFNYNIISDPNNLGGANDALIYSIPPSTGLFIPNVKNNCWGTNFNYAEDLYCSTGCSFTYLPISCPPGMKSMYIDEEAEQQYVNAKELLQSGAYADAKTVFESIVHNYPNSLYSNSSLKELFIIEELTSADFASLRQYYLNDDTISNNLVLLKIADVLANKCNEKLGNWSDCISWYEDIIMNSGNQEDSTYAVIDLGYLYLMMQYSGSKSIPAGNLKQFVPESQSKYDMDCDYLISLLPGNSINKPNNNHLSGLGFGKLLQNNPNPFSDMTEIWYKLEIPAEVIITISDQSGRILKKINQGLVSSGINKVTFTPEGLSSGLYYYSLLINANLSDTKKMTIIKLTR